MNPFLTYSFFVLLLLASCGTYRYPNASGIREMAPEEVNSYYIDTARSFVYRAKLQAFRKDVNGSLLIKPLGREGCRVALISDFGQTLFDISIQPNGHELHYAMHDLNKRALVSEIASVFRIMTAQQHPISALMFADQAYYYPVYVADDCYYLMKGRKVERITQVKRAKEYVLIYYRDWNTAGVPTEVAVEHRKFPLAIDLVLDEEQSTL